MWAGKPYHGEKVGFFPTVGCEQVINWYREMSRQKEERNDQREECNKSRSGAG